MKRRTFLHFLVATPFAALFSIAPAQAQPQAKSIFLQRSEIAGFQHYDGPKLWSHLDEGQALTLQREPYNPYDPRAVAVYWQGHKVGFVPQRENRVIAQMLDKGETLEAEITRLRKGMNPWAPWQFEVRVVG